MKYEYNREVMSSLWIQSERRAYEMWTPPGTKDSPMKYE